jgi:hypothetical protein
MRSIRFLVTALALVAVAAPLGAQQQAKAEPKHEHKQEQKGAGAQHQGMEHMTGWKELDAFHMTMMATWHPAKDGDLTAIRGKSGEMASKAEAWSRSTPPAACDNAETKTKVAAIATDAKALDALVAARGEDAKVKDSLKALHDSFEHVMKACAPKGHGGHE